MENPEYTVFVSQAYEGMSVVFSGSLEEVKHWLNNDRDAFWCPIDDLDIYRSDNVPDIYSLLEE